MESAGGISRYLRVRLGGAWFESNFGSRAEATPTVAIGPQHGVSNWAECVLAALPQAQTDIDVYNIRKNCAATYGHYGESIPANAAWRNFSGSSDCLHASAQMALPRAATDQIVMACQAEYDH